MKPCNACGKTLTKYYKNLKLNDILCERCHKYVTGRIHNVLSVLGNIIGGSFGPCQCTEKSKCQLCVYGDLIKIFKKEN